MTLARVVALRWAWLRREALPESPVALSLPMFIEFPLAAPCPIWAAQHRWSR